MLNKEAFAEAYKRRTKKVHIDSLDMDVYIRPLSAGARAHLADAHKVMSLEGGTTVYEASKEVQWRSVALGLVDENGNRIYEDGDIDQIGQHFAGDTIDQISNEILKASGLGQTAQALGETLKNAPVGPMSASPVS